MTSSSVIESALNSEGIFPPEKRTDPVVLARTLRDRLEEEGHESADSARLLVTLLEGGLEERG